MPTLKEILAERKRNAVQSAKEVSADTQIQSAEAYVPQYVYSQPLNDWDALFEGIEEF